MEIQEVKNIVGTARDLLVGKVPLPVEQCQEITRALIYKFLSAEDALSVGLGGEPSYFTGERAECRWDALMSPEQTANEVDRRYRDGMAMLGRYDNMPAIQTIYKDAYIPYNDPIILRDFLRVIDRFDTGDTEKIGDAYEMLLQDLGAQASAGQFRTPRHIIDFIVAVINPQKHETILDPACGTGGFLASAWEYVNGAGRLSAADRGNLARNLVGYDISPTMEMLSTVNLFLHHKQQPVVSVYDTLTSEERWNDHYDVILANPPFMSPKGGIRPHGRFFSKSSRSEVLFVDYIMGHLNEGGRAGVIVPEGVIFQSQRAHTQLRRLLVGSAIGGLVAVVSLPGGVFQPYSGVKTSILILDKAVARRADGIAFFKVENDGYDLGAQRREIAANDLPAVQAELSEYLRRLRAGESLDDFTPATGLVVAKERIAEGGEYNLSGERYRESGVAYSKFPMVPFAEVCTLEYGASLPKKNRIDGPYPVMGSNGVSGYHNAFLINGPAIIVGRKGSAGEVAYTESDCFPIDTTYYVKVIDQERTDIKYLYHLLKTLDLPSLRGGAGIPGLNRNDVYQKYRLPLPPLEVQREIVVEIEGYQRVIDGARAVVDNWRPRIAVDPEWPLVELGEVCTIVRGSSPRPKSDPRYYGGPVPRLMVADITRDGMYSMPRVDSLTEEGATKSRPMKKGDVIVTVSGNPGLPTILAVDACIHDGFVGLRSVSESVDREYLYLNLLQQHSLNGQQSVGAVFRNLTTHQVKGFKIPLPPLETQRAIVSEIEAERALVSANRELAERMEGRIGEAVGRVWGG